MRHEKQAYGGLEKRSSERDTASTAQYVIDIHKMHRRHVVRRSGEREDSKRKIDWYYDFHTFWRKSSWR
jgi:hypothetical protein